MKTRGEGAPAVLGSRRRGASLGRWGGSGRRPPAGHPSPRQCTARNRRCSAHLSSPSVPATPNCSQQSSIFSHLLQMFFARAVPIPLDAVWHSKLELYSPQELGRKLVSCGEGRKRLTKEPRQLPSPQLWIRGAGSAWLPACLKQPPAQLQPAAAAPVPAWHGPADTPSWLPVLLSACPECLAAAHHPWLPS